jgi:hypothetical protein
MSEARKIDIVTLVDPVYLSEGPMAVEFRAVGFLATEDRNKETSPTVVVTWSLADNKTKSHLCAATRPTKVIHMRLGDITNSAIII